MLLPKLTSTLLCRYNAILEEATGQLFLSIQVPLERGIQTLVVTVTSDAAGGVACAINCCGRSVTLRWMHPFLVVTKGTVTGGTHWYLRTYPLCSER